MFEVLITYFKAHVTYLLNLKNKKYRLAGKHLKNKSYRLPESARTDYLISLRIIKRTLIQLLKKRIRHIVKENDVFIYDESSAYKQGRIDYVSHFLEIKKTGFLGREELLMLISNRNLIFVIIYIMFFSLPLVIVSLLSNNKSYFPLMFLQVIESYILLNTLKTYNAKKLIYFSTYQGNTNVDYILLKKNKIEVVKVITENPIMFWNQVILSDTIIFTSYYQIEEFKLKYKSSIICNNYKLFPPTRVLETLNINKTANRNKGNKTIGFYSSGMWYRDKINDIDLGYNQKNNEEELLLLTSDYISDNPEYKLIIFIHPIEKKEIELTKKYYKKVLKNRPYKIFIAEKMSSYYFYKCELGVSLSSTVIYERLYFGYKTIFYPKDIPCFPIKNTGLYNIACVNMQDMRKKIEESLNQSVLCFFEENKLMKYQKYITEKKQI